MLVLIVIIVIIVILTQAMNCSPGIGGGAPDGN